MGSVLPYPVFLMMRLFSRGNSDWIAHEPRFREAAWLCTSALKHTRTSTEGLNPPTPAIYQVTLWEPAFQSPPHPMWSAPCPHNAINTHTLRSNRHSCLDRSTFHECVYNVPPPHPSHLVKKHERYLFLKNEHSKKTQHLKQSLTHRGGGASPTTGTPVVSLPFHHLVKRDPCSARVTCARARSGGRPAYSRMPV